ncbi:MAG: hypothetical protein A2105_05565 [Omnitrophica WOR_2 bacterium GWF2_63_9]|nr:MAG: hypothetical protein A2105_05565 [Omnitrophica WOR_2 bacterium GWF2_63_9]
MFLLFSAPSYTVAQSPGNPAGKFKVEPPAGTELVRESRERQDMLDSKSPAGLRVVQITTDPEIASSNIYTEIQVFTPDSRRFIFRRQRDYWLCDTGDNFSLRKLTDEPRAQAPSVSPDGKWMYYFVNTTTTTDGALTLKRVSLDNFERQTVLSIDSPIPGTQLYAEHLANQTLKDPSEYQEGDVHGQFIFRHRHPHIKRGQETEFILKAFRRDFEVNGPSVLRIARTVLAGWKRYKNHADARIRNRFAWEARDLTVTFPASLWAARQWFRERNPLVFRKLTTLLDDMKREVGLKARLVAPLAGRIVWSKLRQEARRLKAGWTYEPPTFYETNASMLGCRPHWKFPAVPIHWVAAQVRG